MWIAVLMNRYGHSITMTIKTHLGLCRVRVSLFAALSAAAGYILIAARMEVQLALVYLGVFFLACGASGLNQYQERVTDALMPRTKNRPVPAGRIKPRNALLFSVTLEVVGLTILFVGCGSMSAILGLSASIWYNGLYTLLKRESAFAAIPGAFTGALPPAIGWIAAGGHLSDPRLLAISLFFAIWQVPHFWLFLMGHGNEYRDAGLPSLTQIFSMTQITRIVFQWIAATAVCGPTLCLFGLVQSLLIQYSLIFASVWLILQGARFALNSRAARPAFWRLNEYMIVVVTLLVFDKVLILSGHSSSGTGNICVAIVASYL